MAISESIELAADGSAAIEAQTPETPRSLKPLRTLTVSGGRPGTRLRIEGNWLKDAGFEAGMRVNVHVTHGRLVFELIPTDPSLVTEARKPRRSWVHDYPNLKSLDSYSKDS